MSIQVLGARWSGSRRAVAVLTVVVGVFAMHGLTGNHDATMAGPHPAAALHPSDDLSSGPHLAEAPQSAAAGPTTFSVASAEHPAEHPATGMGITVPASGGFPAELVPAELAPAELAPAKITPVEIAPVEGVHAMAGACVATLTGLLLLLALASALRSLSVWRAVQFAAPQTRPVVTGRSPPWTFPSLTKLCVLRT